jgi:AcrR family transcriptional regulator
MSTALPAPGDPSPAAADALDTQPARAPRRARGQLRVDALLAAAAEVFARKGFDAATMTEIAAQSESSIGSLYQFFRTKEAVADALVREQVDALLVRLDGLAHRASALATADLGHALAVCFVDFRADHPSFATLIERPGPLSPLILGVRRRVRERIEAILAAHAPHVDRKRLHAMAPVVQHVMKSAVQLRGDLDGAELKPAARELEAMLAGYLVARLAA